MDLWQLIELVVASARFWKGHWRATEGAARAYPSRPSEGGKEMKVPLAV